MIRCHSRAHQYWKTQKQRRDREAHDCRVLDNVSRCTHTGNYIEWVDGLLKVMKEQVRDTDLDSDIDLYPLTPHGSLLLPAHSCHPIRP